MKVKFESEGYFFAKEKKSRVFFMANCVAEFFVSFLKCQSVVVRIIIFAKEGFCSLSSYLVRLKFLLRDKKLSLISLHRCHQAPLKYISFNLFYVKQRGKPSVLKVHTILLLILTYLDFFYQILIFNLKSSYRQPSRLLWRYRM